MFRFIRQQLNRKMVIVQSSALVTVKHAVRVFLRKLAAGRTHVVMNVYFSQSVRARNMLDFDGSQDSRAGSMALQNDSKFHCC